MSRLDKSPTDHLSTKQNSMTFNEYQRHESNVRTQASRDLFVVPWTASLQSAFNIMLDKKIRHLPVVHDDGSIIGILSERDLERAMTIDQADFFSARAPQAEFDPNGLVRDFMSWPVETIDESYPLKEAAQIMINKKISALLVTASGVATGIVTTEDLLRAFILNEGLAEEPSSVEKAGLSNQDSVEASLYASPIGSLAQLLANAGI